MEKEEINDLVGERLTFWRESTKGKWEGERGKTRLGPKEEKKKF